MLYTLMLAATVCLLIPYDYQTNIMSMSLDPYTLKEFMKIVIPLQIILTSLSIYININLF